MAGDVPAPGQILAPMAEISSRIDLPGLPLPRAGEARNLPGLRVDWRFGATHGVRTSCAHVRTSCAGVRTSCAQKNH